MANYMIRPRYWIKHLTARRAVRGYPLYDVPHKRAERTMTESEAQENFDYFMNVRLARLAHFVNWMDEHFSIRPTIDGDGLTAVSNWADEFGGGLIRRNDALNTWATYEPIWNDSDAGFNVMIDIGIFQGEYLIARRPRLGWEIYRGREIEPATFESIAFLKPCLGGFSRFWNGFPLEAGAGALLNAHGLATFGDHMSRSRSLITNAQQNLYHSNIPEGDDPVVVGDHRNERL